MVLESATDATFSIRYVKESDRFTIDDASDLPAFDPARLELGESEDFILFDNEKPGALRSATHTSINQLAIDTLAKVVFDCNYRLFCESLREGAQLYNTNERSGEIVVPYSNGRRLARIALHAQAAEASLEVQALQRRIMQTITQ